METEKWFKDILESFKNDFEFRLETIILDLTEQICRKMKEKDINRIKLSELLEVTPSAVTKILNGNSNFTLKTLLSLSDALACDLKINFTEKKPVIYESIPTTSYQYQQIEERNIPRTTSDHAFYIKQEKRPGASLAA